MTARRQRQREIVELMRRVAQLRDEAHETRSFGDVQRLNMDLAHALGVVDTKDVQAVTLFIRAGDLPRVVVERLAPRDTGGLEHVMAEYELIDRARSE